MRRPHNTFARPSKTPLSGITDRACIRELFVERVPVYNVADVLRLTRSTEEEVAAAIEKGEMDASSVGDRLRIEWEDVAALALRRWTSRMVAGALDVTYHDALPPLNQVKQIAVHLPLYQIRLLHVLAETRRGRFRARLNASDILEQQLLDVASSVNAAEIEAAIPGFTLAVRYPYFIPRENDWATAFCRFCGRLSRVAGRERCDDCILRHEPRMHLGEHGVPELDQEEEP